MPQFFPQSLPCTIHHPPAPFAMSSSSASTVTKPLKHRGSSSEGQAAPASDGSSPEAESKTDFFWTYTEEPQRTRRQAIIRAHPEVWHLLLACHYFSCTCLATLETWLTHSNFHHCLDHQALWSRTIDKVPRCRRRGLPDHHRVPSPQQPVLVPSILGRCLRLRGHGQPKSIPRHPRDLTQPCLQKSYRQPSVSYRGQLAHWVALQCFIQGMCLMTTFVVF